MPQADEEVEEAAQHEDLESVHSAAPDEAMSEGGRRSSSSSRRSRRRENRIEARSRPWSIWRSSEEKEQEEDERRVS